MRDLVRATGIARQDDGKPLVRRRRRRKPMPGRDALDRRADARIVRLMRETRKLQIGIARALRLEADDAGKDAAVDFRQHHMHREIGRRQTAQRGRPILAARGRERDLEHGTGCGVERRRSIVADRGEGGGIDDRDRRLFARDGALSQSATPGRLQRRRERTVGLKALLPQAPRSAHRPARYRRRQDRNDRR